MRRAASLAIGLGACSPLQSSLAPAGPGAAGIDTLWWILFWISLAIFLAVLGLLLYGLLRRRATSAPRLPGGETRFVVVGGAVVPAVVLVALLVATVRTGAGVAEPAGPPAVWVHAVGHQFWWEIRYPDHGIVTANEIRIPAGRPVRLTLEAADVIHSFWVPRLHGKMDMVPGRRNEFWIQADSPGVYRGQCAEFCGVQHALMAFLVVAQPAGEFEVWLAGQRRPADAPADPTLREGLRVYLASGCDQCHAIRGIVAPGTPDHAGPDLTHFGSRATIAAATLPNTRGHLGGWILDPQSIKPGNRMPPSWMPPQSLQSLLHYLESLR